MTALIFLDPRLHTPMYFLLSQLSLMDLMYISTTVPKMAINFLSGQKSISFLGCGVQMFFFLTMAGSEGLILASMAYGHFVAICHPLHYPIRMSKSIMVPLACTDTWVYEYTVFVSTGLFLLVPFLGITVSYGRVLFAVFHMNSKEGRRKAFTMCATHLTMVTFYYTPFAYTYFQPKNLQSPAEDKNLAVFYTILTPMLNPIIYSLRNKEVLGAMGRVCGMFSPRKK
ncbi:olfactory receptor 2L13-like [Callospermophilus lateralis]|uniref:olfactory receptor 2L13-like n=1 Tax=Callospermophilus lateralis TaxID=76772 RepID=UPI004038D013